MSKIAYCGLDCEKCEARKATLTNDDALRQKVAQEWSRLNNVTITPEMINCMGCRESGVKTPYCSTLCPIRQCGLKNKYQTCGDCAQVKTCGKLDKVTGNNKDALINIVQNK